MSGPPWSTPHEVEGFDLLHLSWDVAHAWRLVRDVVPVDSLGVEEAARNAFRAPSAEAMLAPDVLYAFSVGVDTAWCLANEPDLERPILVVKREGMTFIIDGYHRLWRAWHDGVEVLPAILLTEDQERRCRLR